MEFSVVVIAYPEALPVTVVAAEVREPMWALVAM